ncbi:hypothetical protein HAX54_024966 [Datura stramonium]|uniref:Uncharacterized protein n=1 Tax=Datura stramonium TaxID=4076 RepID=A0ABS8S648_DATST|nr:hypothetical protein [Datura stramonium]
MLATKNLQRWLNEIKEKELRYEKLESSLAFVRGQSAFFETLAYRDSEIGALRTSVDEGMSTTGVNGQGEVGTRGGIEKEE